MMGTRFSLEAPKVLPVLGVRLTEAQSKYLIREETAVTLSSMKNSNGRWSLASDRQYLSRPWTDVRLIICFAVFGLFCSSSCPAQTVVDRTNCSPQPDCRINYPDVRPGASPRDQVLGGNNSILGRQSDGVKNLGREVNPHELGAKRVCIPWC